MDCQACGNPNPEDARFCGACGGALGSPRACPSCGAAVTAGQHFCNACGARLDEADGDAGARPSFDLSEYRPAHLAERIRAEGSALEGERKQVTVLFADVMESMQLAAQVDAEEWRLVMDRFLSLLCEGVHRFEGTVNNFTGDGIMALFGAPLAHEDHARRACYAALHLREELARYAGELRRERGLNFSVRIGLNSGEVVVGAVGDDLNVDYTAIGNTVGLASRAEQLAEPGKVYLTAATAALAEGYFGLRELGDFEIKGADKPVRIFELAGVGSARTRVEAARERGLSRFVGRDQELAALESSLARAHEGTGQVVGVVADPGLGKSRLCYEFVERCRERGLEVVEGHGVAHGRRIPLLPVLEMMRGYFGIADDDGDRASRDKIAGRLLMLDDSFKDLLPVLFDFLGVPDPERPPPANAEARQRQLLPAIRRMVEVGGQINRTVILVEDLHWLDPGSEVFLANLIEGLASTHTLMIANFRPEYQAAWMRRSNYEQMPLSPLGEEAMTDLLEDLLGGDPSLDGLAELIQQRTEGNPFYIEEVVQGLVDGGSLAGSKGAYRLVKSIDQITIPPTVQAVLQARIDSLSERDKAVLQTAAVIGKEFSESVLRRVVDLPASQLAGALRALTAGEFVYERSVYPEVEFAFKHPLTEEVAYRSQLGPRRVRTHAAVARAIPEAYPEGADELAALVANHWEQGADPLEAARWNARAAAWAGQKHPPEAARHWRAVRSLAGGLPDSPEEAGLRFAACLSILQFGGWRMGMPEHEIAEVYEDGRAAAEQLGQPQMVAAMLGSYATARGFLGHADEAIVAFEQVRKIAEECDDKDLLTVGQLSTYWLTLVGRLGDAFAVVEEMIESTQSDPNLGRATFGFCARAWAEMWRGWVLGHMGRLEESRASFDEASDLARAYDDAETLGWTLCSYAQLAWLSGEPGDSLRRAREGALIAEGSGSSISLCLANLTLAFAYLARGEWDEAQAAAERALEMVRGAHTGLQYESLILSMIAEAKLATGDYAGGLEAAEQGVASAQDSKTRLHELEARLSLARAVLASEGTAARVRIAQLLDETMALALECGAGSHVPRVHIELAELSHLEGDEEGYERELREAQRLFEEIGARGRAAAVSSQLAALPA